MNKNIWISFFCFSIAYPLFATADDPRDRQEEWARHHRIVTGIIGTSNPNLEDPLPEFSKLTLNERPHPELYHLYLREHDGGEVNLVKDFRSQTLRLVRLYGASNRDPSYVTIGCPKSWLPKETLVTPLSRYEPSGKSASYPTGASTSYPEGLKTYYIMVNGKKIRFDRGHGIPNEDTLGHMGTTSTRDAENYVPQNIKYNSPIRRDLEAHLRDQGLKYKEIAIYHSDCFYEATVSKVKTRFQIPVPEGFLFMTYKEDGEIQDTYYFPNFIDYEALAGSTPLKGNKNKYERFAEFYRIPNLADWFFNPIVTLGSLEEQEQQVEKARTLGCKILLSPLSLFFDRRNDQHRSVLPFTEEQMPPKARVALLTTLLEWNVEAAATLELTFENQLDLARFYLTSRRSFWELDSRYDTQKQRDLQEFLSDPIVSPTARNLVLFLRAHLDFPEMQYELDKVIADFKERYRNAPHKWGQDSEFFQRFAPIEITLTAKNGDTHQYNFLQLLPTDLPKLQKLVGGTVNHNLPRSRYILSMIDARARQTPSTIMEKLGIMRLYHDQDALPNEDVHLSWEKSVFDQVHSDPNVTLLDRRRIVDYYAYRNRVSDKAFWLNQFVSYVTAYPTLENFFNIAQWCVNERSAFLEDMTEQDSSLRASNIFALHLFKGLRDHYHPIDYRDLYNGYMTHLEKSLGLDIDDSLGTKRAHLLHPDVLDPFIQQTGCKLKQLSYLFLHSLHSGSLSELRVWKYLKGYVPIPLKEFEENLAPKSVDFKDEATFYQRLGFTSQAKKAAQKCYKSAQNLPELKDSAIILHHVGLRNLAMTAAQRVFEDAREYRTRDARDYVEGYQVPVDYLGYIYAVEAFHALGEEALKQEAKQKCFSVIGENHFDLVGAASKFHELRMHDFAREAAQRYFEHVTCTKDLSCGVQIFSQYNMTNLGREAASIALRLAKDPSDFKEIAWYHKILCLPSPVSPSSSTAHN